MKLFLLKAVLLLTVVTIVATGCTSYKRVINGRPQTFYEYVVTNKYSEEYRISQGLAPTASDWGTLTSNSFIGIRYLNWVKAKEETNGQN